jgi:hypothetical protein
LIALVDTIMLTNDNEFKCYLSMISWELRRWTTTTKSLSLLKNKVLPIQPTRISLPFDRRVISGEYKWCVISCGILTMLVVMTGWCRCERELSRYCPFFILLDTSTFIFNTKRYECKWTWIKIHLNQDIWIWYQSEVKEQDIYCYL